MSCTAEVSAPGLGVATPNPDWSANVCLSAPPEGGAVLPGICAMMLETRFRSLTLALGLCGIVDILLFGKAVGPTVVDTGYVGTLGRMLRWAGNGLVLLEIAGREVNGCERSEGDLGLGSRKTISEDDLVPRRFRENLGGKRGSRISEA